MIGRSNINIGSDLNFQIGLASAAPNQIENLVNLSSYYIQVDVDNEAKTISYLLKNQPSWPEILYFSKVGEIEAGKTYYFRMIGSVYGNWYLSTSSSVLENSIQIFRLTTFVAPSSSDLFLCFVYYNDSFQQQSYSDLYFSTEPPGYLLPDTAKENTILIESTLPFSKYSISGNLPENPIKGDICIEENESTEMTINVFHKNPVILPIENVKQYTGTSWSTVTAHIYQNGIWIQF